MPEDRRLVVELKIVNRFTIPCPVCRAAPGEDHVAQVDEVPVDASVPPNRPYPSTTANRPEAEL